MELSKATLNETIIGDTPIFYFNVGGRVFSCVFFFVSPVFLGLFYWVFNRLFVAHDLDPGCQDDRFQARESALNKSLLCDCHPGVLGGVDP